MSNQNVQLHDIVTPHEHDVLSGRGNFVNYHAGNEHFRALVRKHKVAYVACPKPQKGKFSRMIVDEIRNRNPPGRFLKQDAGTKLWHDIGEKKALDKTRQALREGAPEIMKELGGDEEGGDGDHEAPISTAQKSIPKTGAALYGSTFGVNGSPQYVIPGLGLEGKKASPQHLSAGGGMQSPASRLLHPGAMYAQGLSGQTQGLSRGGPSSSLNSYALGTGQGLGLAHGGMSGYGGPPDLHRKLANIYHQHDDDDCDEVEDFEPRPIDPRMQQLPAHLMRNGQGGQGGNRPLAEGLERQESEMSLKVDSIITGATPDLLSKGKNMQESSVSIMSLSMSEFAQPADLDVEGSDLSEVFSTSVRIQDGTSKSTIGTSLSGKSGKSNDERTIKSAHESNLLDMSVTTIGDELSMGPGVLFQPQESTTEMSYGRVFEDPGGEKL